MENKKNFSKWEELCANYDKATANRESNPEEFNTALIELARGIAASVFKKVHEKSGNDTIGKLRCSMFSDNVKLDSIGQNAEIMSHMELKEKRDGEIREVSVIDSKGAKETFDTLASDTISDGEDAVNVAVVALLEELKNGHTTVMGSYSGRKLKSTIRIKDAEPVWEDYETTPMGVAYRAVRMNIQKNGAVENSTNKYSYLSELVTDTETGTTAESYIRLEKYSQLASCVDSMGVVGMNGKKLATADEKTVEEVREIVESLSLSALEKRVLEYRLSGYGNKAIATRLKLSLSTVKSTRLRIQKKAVAFGLEI